MLEALRNSVNTWTAKILLGLLVVSFAVWGVADVFTGRTDSVVASVGENGEIEAQQYALSMSDQLQNLQRQTGQAVSLSDARSLGLDDLVLAQLSTREALNQEAQVFGLSASDSDIRDAISNAPSFQGPGGTFDRTTYERQVRNRGLTVKNFEQEVRVDLARESMLQAVGVGTSAPRPLAEALYRFRNERRQLDYILLTPSMADDPGEPDEETLTAFHSANAEDFTAPEYRKVGIVWLTPDAFADEIEIPEERIVATYEERRNAGEFTTLATRTVEQLLFDTEEDATAARARIDSGEASFADLAAEKEQTAADISLGEVEQADLPAAYADAAFGVEEPGVLGPVKNVFGWALLNVTAVKPESIATLEDERQRIRDDLASAEARNLIPEEMVAVDDELAGGATPEAAARLTAAKYVMLDGIDEMGRTVEGRPNAGVPPIPGILDTIFSTETGIEPVLTEADSGGFYALRVEEVIPAALRPLEEVRDEVAAAWEREQRTAALSEIADGYRDRLAGDETLEQIAESEGYRIATTGPILRNSPSGTLTQVLRDTMFRVDEGDLLRGPNSDGSGYVFGVLAEIVHEDAEAVEAAIDVETERYAAALSNDLVQTFTRTAQERHPTRVHPAVVESVLSELGQRY